MKAKLSNYLFPCLLLACGGGYVSPGYIDPEQGSSEHLIVFDRWYRSGQAWRESPWYRLEDEPVVAPIYIMVDGGANACLVPADVYALNPQRIACPTGWRRPRLR